MSDTNRTEASGNAPVCVHDDASVSPQEGSLEASQGSQGEVTQSPEAEKGSLEVTVPEHAGSDVHDNGQSVDKGDSGLEKAASDCEESKSNKTENPEGCVQFDISCELGGVSTDIKTAFKDVQSEIFSAVSEVKSELSHVLQSSTQFCLGATDQDGTSGGDSRDPDDNVLLIKDESEVSEHPFSVRDIVIHKCSTTEGHLEKVDLPVFNFKETDGKVVTDPVRDEPNRADCSSWGEGESSEFGEGVSPYVAMALKTDSSVDKDEVFTTFGLHDELSKNIAIEVTEDFLKEKVDSLSTERIRKEKRFDVKKVFAGQARLSEECESEKEESSSHLVCHSSDEHALKAQPLSAPSTPVPSTSGTGRKALRSVCRGRRVSFPEDETHLISSYLEPVNPWQQMGGTTVEEIATAYRMSCERHRTQPLPGVLQQIKALPLVLGGRVECLSLRSQRLDSSQCECLEEIFRRVQFKILDLEGCCLDDDTAIPLFDMIEFYDSVTQLNISCNDKIGFRGWQACSKMLKRTPSVEYLDARNTNLNETNMPILSRALRLGSRLHTLHLESCNLTGRPLIILTAALRQNETLTELYLADNRLGVNDCIQLSNLVRANSTLHILDLRNNNVQDAGCNHVCEGITEQQKHQQQQQGEEGGDKSRCRGLRSLVLWNNHLTPQSAPHLANMLAITRALETLNLGRNNLTSEGVLRLKESLLRNRALLRLGLQAARIADEGAVALAEYTADNRVIQHVDLRDNPIHVAGLLALAHSLRLNSTVIQMDIDSDCRSEPSAELAEQHASLQKEIKEICQRNLTQSHLKAVSQPKTETPEDINSKPAKKEDMHGGVIRKISLTCETTVAASQEFSSSEVVTREEEKQKYISPAPSPIPSPCPSPCPSPSPSPVPSPLRNNRFKVFKVAESSKSSPNLIANISQPTMGCNVVHVSQSGRSLSAGDLTQAPKQSGTRPNRFGRGGRFTVTRVTEPCSLPSTQEAASFTLSSSYTNTNSGSGSPKIVISSPVRVERGFSVETTTRETTEKPGDKQNKCDPIGIVDFKTVKVPEDALQSGQDRHQFNCNATEGANLKKCSSESPRQELSSQKSLAVFKNNAEGQKSEKDCDSPNLSELTDSGFLDEGSCGRSSGSVSPSPSTGSHHPMPEGDRDSLLSSSMDSTSQEDTGLGLPMQGSEPASPVAPCSMQQFDIHSVHDPPKRAPLAAMENGSFDSDSEDSELMTQSSDSTHSDEVRITTEQFEPRAAWGSKPEQQQVCVASEVTAPTESG